MMMNGRTCSLPAALRNVVVVMAIFVFPIGFVYAQDFKAVQQLQSESSILEFVADGDPPESYLVRFFGKGLWRPERTNDVLVREQHEMTIDLSAAYPRMQPELAWKTPIFHPNISASGTSARIILPEGLSSIP